MEQIVTFAASHYILVGSLITLLCLLVITEIRKGAPSISSQDLTRLVNKENAVVIDVREKVDFNKGHIVSALNFPYSTLKERTSELSKYQDSTIIIVDAMGQHAGTASKWLKESGIAMVMRLKGGISGWQADSLPLIKKQERKKKRDKT